MSSKPIKRSKALMPLSREHHFDLLLAWKIRKGIKSNVEAERMNAYIQYLDKSLMKEHFRDEEVFLFDLLPADDEMCQRARKEHDEIRKMITEIKKSGRNDELFNNFADAVEAHVRYEERDLFPYLEEKLSSEKLEKIENEIAGKHDMFVEQWEDEFWTEK